MNFLTPLFLLGGLAVALPVAFHLVRRSSRERQLFSSLLFLQPSPPRLTRRHRVEHLLLLLLRCLVLGLLACAFARPFFPPPGAAAAPAAPGAQIVILLDTSASMKRDGVWPAALARAASILKRTTPADEIAILTFADQVRPLLGFAEWTARNGSDRAALAIEQLNQLQTTWHGTHLGHALLAAAELFTPAAASTAAPGERRIVLISDLQEGSRLEGLQGYDWPPGVQVEVEVVKASRSGNAGLQWVPESETAARPSSDIPVRLRINNAADSRREQFQIRWAAGGELDAYVPPGQSRTVSGPPATAQPLVERVTLTGDEESFDNTVFVLPPHPEELNVLYLGPDAETDPAQSLYYLQRAFQETRRQIVRLLPRATDAGAANYRLAIITGGLNETEVRATRHFITNGGTALLVMTGPESSEALGALVGNPAVSAPEVSGAGYTMFGAMDFTHPLLAPFADPRFGDFTKVRFWRHRRLAVESFARARVIASYDDHDPAIVEIPAERGRIFVFTFSWRPADSQLALSSKFVPLLYSLLDQAGGSATAPGQYRVGDVVALTAPTATSIACTIRKPDGATAQLPAGQTVFTETDQPGLYEILTPTTARPAGLPGKFVVNLDPGESRTTPLPGDELERLGVPIQAGLNAPPVAAARQQSLQNAELEARQKMWRWLLVGALALLLSETWLAGWITRRALAPGKAAA